MDDQVHQGQAEHNADERKLLLLQDAPLPDVSHVAQRNRVQNAISMIIRNLAHLANLLPTGTVLAFQLLSPVCTNVGDCNQVNRTMTTILIALCGLSSFLLSFTDSFKDKHGNIYYGFATFSGLWVIDGFASCPPKMTAKYRLHFIDFLHAFMTVFVFAAIALLDNNTVQCFYPMPSRTTKEILAALPVGIGVVCSSVFVVFPTQRHGVGFLSTVH